jgi:hypothetical protein
MGSRGAERLSRSRTAGYRCLSHTHYRGCELHYAVACPVARAVCPSRARVGARRTVCGYGGRFRSVVGLGELARELAPDDR